MTFAISRRARSYCTLALLIPALVVCLGTGVQIQEQEGGLTLDEVTTLLTAGSPMATSLVAPSVFMAWIAAPLPRPPQPIRPILIVSLPNACAPRATLRPPETAPPATRMDELLMNSRRDVLFVPELVESSFIATISLPVEKLPDIVPAVRSNRDSCLQR